MGLQRQNITLSFNQGLDTKTDPKQVLFGRLLTLENAIFISPQRLIKRNGNAVIGNKINAGSALASFQNELIAFDGTSVLSLSLASTSYQNKGVAISMEITENSAIQNQNTQTVQDSTFHPSGYECYVWEDSTGGSRFAVRDRSTGTFLVSNQQLNASAQKPKVFSLANNFIFIFYSGGNNLTMATCSIVTPSTLVGPTTIATDVNSTNPTFDAKQIGQRVFISYNTTAGGGSINTFYINAALTVSAKTTKAAEAATTCISIFGDANQVVYVTYWNGTNVRMFTISYELILQASAITVEAVANIRNICGISYQTISSSAANVIVFYEVSAANQFDNLTRYNTVAMAAVTLTPGTPGVFQRSAGLASKPFTYKGNFYITLTYGSALQPTYFVANVFTSGAVLCSIVGKIASQVGGGLTAKSILPEVNNPETSTFFVAFLRRAQLTVSSGVVFSPTSVIGVNLNFISQNTFLRAQMASNLHYTGGFLTMYDGFSSVEHGFHVFPETPTASSAVTGGALVAGTYQYVACYEWTDNQGNIHRSAPSLPVTLITLTGTAVNFTATTTINTPTLTSVSSLVGLIIGQVITGAGIPVNTFIIAFPSGTSITMSNNATASAGGVAISTVYTNKPTLVASTLRLTSKKSPRANVSICFYRTPNNQTTFFKVTSPTSPTFNDPTVDTVSFIDTVSDFSLVGNEILYTTGGVLENIPPPAISLITNYKNRIAVVPSENKLSFWISKENIPGGPVEFSDTFVKNIDGRGGDITAIAQMDEKLVLFKRNIIYSTVGDGPNDTGTFDDLQKPQLVNTDSGCINPRSIGILPDGLIYQSGKGIMLLNRAFQVSYIGAPVEAFNNLTITSTTVVPNTNQVRFTTTSGVTLVYDYFFQQWSTFTNQFAVDAAVFGNLFCTLDSSGNTYQETVGQFLDAGAPIKIRLKTGWLNLAGLQGFQRVRRMLILGEYKSPHSLNVNIGYDFNPSATQQSVIEATALDPTVYGEDTPYGEEELFGGEFPLYQWLVHFDRQKCESIQIEVEETQVSDFGEGLNLSAFTLQVGAKEGLNKLRAIRSVGSSVGTTVFPTPTFQVFGDNTIIPQIGTPGTFTRDSTFYRVNNRNSITLVGPNDPAMPMFACGESAPSSIPARGGFMAYSTEFTNWCLQNNNFSVSPWAPINTGVAVDNVITGPDGTINAAQISGTSFGDGITQTISARQVFAGLSAPRIFYIWAKVDSGSRTFSMELKETNGQTSGIISKTVTSEWQQFSVSRLFTSTVGFPILNIYCDDTTGYNLYVSKAAYIESGFNIDGNIGLTGSVADMCVYPDTTNTSAFFASGTLTYQGPELSLLTNYKVLNCWFYYPTFNDDSDIFQISEICVFHHEQSPGVLDTEIEVVTYHSTDHKTFQVSYSGIYFAFDIQPHPIQGQWNNILVVADGESGNNFTALNGVVVNELFQQYNPISGNVFAPGQFIVSTPSNEDPGFAMGPTSLCQLWLGGTFRFTKQDAMTLYNQYKGVFGL